MTLECIYYLVREMDGLGIRAGDKHFNGALEHVREHGLVGMRRLEIDALARAAAARNREAEMDEAVEQGTRGVE